MPEVDLYTDWNLYDQILYQIVQNSIMYNKKDGAVAISIMFMKERRNMTCIEESGLVE
jgi:hypothetical protein